MPGLVGPPIPASMRPSWRLFLEISRGRTMHAAGPNPLTWPDLAAYCDVTGTRFDPVELAAVLALDRVFLNTHAEAANRRMKK